MGRQINFYMDESTEINFLKFAESEGFMFLYEDLKEEKMVEYKSLNEIPFQSIKIFKLYLYKDFFGEFKFTNFANYRIDSISSPVIEYRRTSVNDEEKLIYQGRMWIESQFYKDGVILKKSEEFIKSYEMICKWIKKNVPKKEIAIYDYISKEYINDRILEKVQEGYNLRR